MPRLGEIRARLEAIEDLPGPWERGGPYPAVSVIYESDPGCGYPEPEPPIYEAVAMIPAPT